MEKNPLNANVQPSLGYHVCMLGGIEWGGGPLKGKHGSTGPNSCTCTAPTPILATQGGTQVAYRYLSRFGTPEKP